MAAGANYDRTVENVRDTIGMLAGAVGTLEARSLDSICRFRLSVQTKLLKGRSWFLS
jgi:hypothetical protein